jgi:hypothetical protein
LDPGVDEYRVKIGEILDESGGVRMK